MYLLDVAPHLVFAQHVGTRPFELADISPIPHNDGPANAFHAFPRCDTVATSMIQQIHHTRVRRAVTCSPRSSQHMPLDVSRFLSGRPDDHVTRSTKRQISVRTQPSGRQRASSGTVCTPKPSPHQSGFSSQKRSFNGEKPLTNIIGVNAQSPQYPVAWTCTPPLQSPQDN